MVAPGPLVLAECLDRLWLFLRDSASITYVTLQEMMECVRRHQVNLRGVVSTVVVTTLVLEGW